MARFLVWSDLHDEFWEGFDLPDPSAPVDGVLIAGDTHTMGRHLDIPARAARKSGCPVVVIWGNHEPYGSIWSELMADEERQLAALSAEGFDIRVLHGAATEVAGVRIIGATLWTDLRLYPPFEDLARLMVSAYMQDYRAIRTVPKTRFPAVLCKGHKCQLFLFLVRSPTKPVTILGLTKFGLTLSYSLAACPASGPIDVGD